MRREEFGTGEERLVLVLGWGNRPEHAGVQWLVEQLTDAGYRVTAFEIPTTITDFEAEWLAPVAEYVADLDEYRLLSHSTGGLIARHVEADDRLRTRTYLSPWWGFAGSMQNLVVSLAMKLPISTPILPTGDGDETEDLGALVTEEAVADGPDRAAPTFLREAKRGQTSMPPFDERDVVFYTPSDAVVGTHTIEAQTPPGNRITYDGGHELFCSRCREDRIGEFLAAVDRGLAGIQ
jgi:hypothetical protein